MTMVSKYPLDKAIQQRVFEIFLSTLADLKTSSEVQLFIDQFFTPTERMMFAKRLSIAFLLAKNYDIRMISKILKVSTKTVTTVNIWIKHYKGGLYSTINKIINQEKQKEFWKELEYDLSKATIPFAVGNWSNKRRNIEKNHFPKNKPF